MLGKVTCDALHVCIKLVNAMPTHPHFLKPVHVLCGIAAGFTIVQVLSTMEYGNTVVRHMTVSFLFPPALYLFQVMASMTLEIPL